jgi:hypothetical protein
MKKIFVDFGGTIVRDKDAYVSLIGDYLTFYPDQWIVVNDFLDSAQREEFEDNYINRSVPYPVAMETITSFCGMSNEDKSQVFVLFDNKPHLLSQEPQETVRDIAFWLDKNGCKVNGIYVESDKLGIAKQCGVDIFVEDDPRIAITLANAGIKAILMLRSWNKKFSLDILDLITTKEKQEKIKENILFADDWQEAGCLIKSLL